MGKIRKNIIKLSSTELAQGVVSVKDLWVTLKFAELAQSVISVKYLWVTLNISVLCDPVIGEDPLDMIQSNRSCNCRNNQRVVIILGYFFLFLYKKICCGYSLEVPQ